MDLSVVLKFLKALSKNNDREWFEKNKPKYLEAKAQFEEAVVLLHHELLVFDKSLEGLDPKKLTFRIYRDVRFSKDKRPYKTNMGAAFSSKGKMVQEPGYYFHLEPGNKSLLAIGLYQPEPEVLAKIRQEIDYNGDRLAAIMADKKMKKVFPEFEKFDALKLNPKGYAKDHPYIDWLKLKSLVVTTTFKDDEVVNKKFIKQMATMCKTAKPLNDFLQEAIS